MTTHSSALEMILAENLSLYNDKDVSPENVFSSHDVKMMKSLKIRSPGVYYFIGGTMADKTTLLAKILLHRHNILHTAIKNETGEWKQDTSLDNIHYFKGSTWQSQPFNTLEKEGGVKFYSTFPTKRQIEKLVQNNKKTKKQTTTILIFHDWMNQLYKNDDMVDVLTKMVYHLNILVFITQQALYPRSINATALRSQAWGFFSSIFRQSTTHCVNGFINFLQINKM